MRFLFHSFLIVMFSAASLTAEDAADDINVVKVVAKDYRFEVQDSIPSGWTTFQFDNVGHAEHFFLLNLLPDSISYDVYVDNVPMEFQFVYDSLREGMSKTDAINLLVESIPAWYFTAVKQMGGTGIVSAGKSTTVTLNLPPGTYVMECYIKEGDLFHTTLGMISPMVVTAEKSKSAPPKADVTLSLTNFQYETEGTLSRGENTVAVKFLEHPEVGLGNDVHIVRLDTNVAMDEVISWLDWMEVAGLRSPAPVEFLGGAQEMPIGETAYFTVELEPGRYAWIAESSGAQGMVKEFIIE